MTLYIVSLNSIDIYIFFIFSNSSALNISSICDALMYEGPNSNKSLIFKKLANDTVVNAEECVGKEKKSLRELENT